MSKVKESFYEGLGKMDLYDMMVLHEKLQVQTKKTEDLVEKLKEVQSKVKVSQEE